jgi:hypothetical protein
MENTGEILQSAGIRPDIKDIVAAESKERRKSPDTREQVLEAFNSGFSLLEEADKAHSLSSTEKWVYKTITDAKARTLDAKKETYTNIVTSPAGETFRIQERIPIEGLLAFVDKKLKEAESASDTTSADKYRSILTTLAKNGRLYKRPGRDLGEKGIDDFTPLIERVRQEAYLISSPTPDVYIDPRDRHDSLENWKLADEMINGRIELFLPKAEATIDSSADTPDEPNKEGDSSNDKKDLNRRLPGKPYFGGHDRPDFRAGEPDTPPLPGSAPTPESEPPVDEPGDDEDIPRGPSWEDRTKNPYVVLFGSNEAEVRKHVKEFVENKLQEEEKERYGDLPKNVFLRAGRLIAYQATHPKVIFAGIRREYVKNMRIHDLLKELEETSFSATADPTCEAARMLNELREKGLLAQQAANNLGEANGSGREGIKLEGYDAFELTGQFKQDVMERMLIPSRDALKNGASAEEVQAQIQDKLFKYVTEHQGNDAISQKIKEFLGKNTSRYGELSKFYASNLLETAQRLNEDEFTRTLALDMMDQIVKIKLTKAQEGAASEVPYTVFERLIATTQKRRLGCWITPAMAAATVAVGASVYRYGSKAIVKKGAILGATILVSPWAAPIAGVAIGAAYAWKRESKRLKDEMQSVGVDIEHGRKTENQKSWRRKELEGITEKISVRYDQLINGDRPEDEGEQITGGVRKREAIDALVQKLGDLSALADTERAQVLEQAASRYAEIFTRLEAPEDTKRGIRKMFSPSLQEMGRVRYSEAGIDAGRLELINKMITLNHAVHEAGITDDTLEEEKNRWRKVLLNNREDQERAFRKLILKRGLQKAVFAGTVGAAAGFLDQEAFAQVARHVPGLSETNFGHHMQGETQIEKAAHHFGVGSEHTSPPVTVEKLQEAYQNGGNINLSDHLQAHVDPSTHMVTLFENGHALQGNAPLTLSGNGSLHFQGDIPQNLQEVLHSDGITINPGEAITQNHPDVTILGNSEGTYDAAIGGGHTYEDALHNGVLTSVPKGTEWIPGANNTHELVVKGHHDIILATADSQNHIAATEYGKDLLDIGQTTRGGETTIVNKEILGDQGLWEKMGTPINHREWYSYDQPGSQGNELRLYTEKSGDSVILSMQNMHLAYQRGLHPNPIDVQQVIKDNQATFAFSLPQFQGHPVLIPDSIDGTADGLLNLNPNDTTHFINLPDGSHITLGEFSKMVVNENGLSKLHDGDIATELYHHQDVFNLGQNGQMGFIEAGRPVTENGQTAFQAFATIRGASPIPQTLTQTVEAPPVNITSINLTGPITEHVPPTIINTFDLVPPHGIDPPPMIPIPFDVRSPLEEAENIPGVYYAGREPTDKEKLLYNSRKSPRLKDNPQAKLNAKEEAEWYFEQQPTEYREELRKLNESIGEPMSDNCRVAICMAAASHQEGKNIYNTLLQYADQRDTVGNVIDPSTYEINLFLNRPESSTADETASEVVRFQREHPEIKVRVFGKTFSTKQKMGVISKYVADMALLRSLQRKNPVTADLLLVTNDADADLISKGYINSLIKEQEDKDKQYIDATLGKIEWNPESYIRFPGFHVANRFIQYIDAGVRHEAGDRRGVGSSGANFAIKSSMYAAIGGYITTLDEGQDVALSKMIKYNRNPNNTIPYTHDNYPIDYLGSAWIMTNPRRGISYYSEGTPIVRQWGDFGIRQGVRENDWRSQTVTTETIDTMSIDHLQNEINATIEDYGLDANSDIVKRALQFLHIDYRIENNQIIITDISRLKEDLRNYQNTGRDQINELKNQSFTRATSTP